jgi:hypothetical protein
VLTRREASPQEVGLALTQVRAKPARSLLAENAIDGPATAYAVFQLAEVAVPRPLFAALLERIGPPWLAFVSR